MTNAHGAFIWYELMTADPEAAKAFYDSAVGWEVGPRQPGDMDYRMIVAPDGMVGGVMGLNQDMIANGAKPVWMGYFGVDDVDATVDAVVKAGGQVHLPAFDIPDIGRIAMVGDPQGVPIYVMRGASNEASTAYSRNAMGHVCWNELLTPDPDAALAFYAATFNVTKIGAMPMGEMGDYSFIANGDSNGEAVGAVMKTPAQGYPGWGFYFRVPEIQAAIARVEKAGGKVTHGPMEVPGGEWVINVQDPEGVHFGLVAPANNG